ncbi:COX15/CtaA family protein [Nocardioides sp. TF02-7]|uniref:COX15/CtaA family protein n=1 Tax=Nocardioides sp. TF02-7 TaxID=2917724 RepID=UPI001F05BA0F|nr:COX15/CtaA family protein [Nocardioides sp. TF02-7]UMG92410.1 COX15/CtaA family protein [Nocardioides sp. TF02-7]
MDNAAKRLLVPLAIANLVVNIGIVVTGGAVRLTGSGLGCPTWPRCTDESYVPHGELGMHGAIEFGNRLLTFAVAAVALLTFLAAWRSGDRRARLLALLVGLYIPAQAVIGGITVLTDLNPWVVSLHFLSSMVIIGLCVVLLDHLRGPVRTAAAPRARQLAWGAFALGWVVLYLGTVVTGSGPHSGDLDSRRTGLDPQVMSHVHAWVVYALVAVTLALVVVAVRGGHRHLLHATLALLAVEVAQGVIGFVQYFNDLPEWLVLLHMLGAALTAAVIAWVVLAARARRPSRAGRPGGAGRPGRLSGAAQPQISASTATATNSSER